MKSLVVEDDFVSRLVMQKLLLPFGECHIAVNGKEALAAFLRAMSTGEPYQLICLDIMMPEVDGQAALKEIRAVEERMGIMVGDGVKVIITTALNDFYNKLEAVEGFSSAYLVKPIEKEKLLKTLREIGLIA